MAETTTQTPGLPGADRASQILHQARTVMDDLLLGPVQRWKCR